MDAETPPNVNPTHADDSAALDSIVDDLIAGEPRVNPAAIDSLTTADAQTESGESGENAAAHTDGAPPRSAPIPGAFDPAIHQTKNGKPVRTKDGKFARKPGPRGKAAPAAAPKPAAAAEVIDAPQMPDYNAAGQMLAGMIFGTGQALFGDAWKPDAGEEKNVTDAAARVCAVNGYDIPPGVALIAAIAIYAMPRFNDPETRSRVRGMAVSLGLAKPAFVHAPPPPESPKTPTRAAAHPLDPHADGGVLARMNGDSRPFYESGQ